MPWTETPSLSFTARHEGSQADAALAVLESLEAYRTRLEELFPSVPAGVTVVLHDSPLQLALARPLFVFARRITVPAGRRYLAGWAGGSEVHTLAPQVLRRQAGGPESLKALLLSPERAYTSLVIGFNNPLLPPPLRPRSVTHLLRFAWLPEGAAQFLCGQVAHLRPALARRLRGRAPGLPPSLRDAALLGGTLFDLLERERGIDACVALALRDDLASAEAMIEESFGSSLAAVRERWRTHLEELARPQPAVSLELPPAGNGEE